MSLHRKALREAAIVALQANARFAAFKTRRAWAQNIDTAGLPCFSVSTFREASKSQAVDLIRRQVELNVLIQRKGGDDLDDKADLDAEAAETAVLTALESLVLDIQIAATELRIAGEGSSRIATLDLRFTAIVLTDRQG